MPTHLCLLLSSCLGLFPLPGLLYLQQLSPISCFPLSTVFNLPISSFFPSALDFPGGPDGKVSVYNVGNPALIPGLGRSPGEGNGNPLQYYCTMPGKSHEQRSQVGYSPWGCKESDTTERVTHTEYGKENHRVCHKICHLGIHNFGSPNLFPVRREL